MPGSDGDNPRRRTERSPYLVAVSEETRPADRQDAPSARRNCGPILAVLKEYVPQSGSALEIASGTGQHVTAFAGAWPAVSWLPSDPHPRARASVEAWVASAALKNVRPPAAIDVTDPRWHAALDERFDLMVCINMLHISPWTACEGLMAGAGALLRPGGHLFVYGCFKRGGEHTAESNARFDESLRSRDARWGVRDLEEVAGCAETRGLAFIKAVDMPANNLSVVFRRRGDGNPP